MWSQGEAGPPETPAGTPDESRPPKNLAGAPFPSVLRLPAGTGPEAAGGRGDTQPPSFLPRWLWASLILVLLLGQAVVDRFIPGDCEHDPDRTHRARLIVHFGFQGFVFGTIYAVFYHCIDH